MNSPSTEARLAPQPPLIDQRWYACYTRGNHEKRVAVQLREQQIESFLPLCSQLRTWTDRKKRVAWPLFPGYVFARFRLLELPRVLDIYGLVTVVRSGSAPSAIPDGEIENVRRFVQAVDVHGIAHHLDPYPEIGDRVRINAGPLCGVEGVVLEWRRGRTRVLIGLHAVGQGLSVNVDTASLQRLGERREPRERWGERCSPP